MKIKILKENFPGEMPTGPSLGQPGGLKSPMPERQRKIMALIEVVGSKLDELQNYTGIYTHVTARWNNLKQLPKYRKNRYGFDTAEYGPDGKELFHTMEETALIEAERFAQHSFPQGSTRFVKSFGKVISQCIQVTKRLEEVNQYLVLIETLELDKDLALHVKKHIYKDRAIKFDYAGTYMPRLFNYGDYLAASGLAIKSLATVMPQQLGEPSVGQAIKDTAESFTENFKSLWVMMSEELIASGDHLEKRSDFVIVLEPEILKYMMKVGHPVSLFDLRNEGFYEEMMEKFPITGVQSLGGFGGAKVFLRKALRTLTDKGYIVQDDPSQSHRGMQTTFIINPQMTQQTGEEYFPKPEGIMEMKITKKKLKQLIMEEMRHFRPAPYDPRADKEYPQHADKLTNLAASGPEGYQQAIGLSDALDGEPIDIPVPAPEDKDHWFWNAPFMGRSDQYKKMIKEPWNAAKGKFYIWAQKQPHFQKRNAPGVRSIFHLPKPQRYEELKNFLRDTGDQESYDVMKRTLERSHMSTYLNNDQVKYNNNTFDLYESTEQQKKQQRKDNWDSRDKQRRKIKAKIKRSQNKGETPFKNERPDFDPIHDLGKAMKKRYKDLEVRANGEEIEE